MKLGDSWGPRQKPARPLISFPEVAEKLQVPAKVLRAFVSHCPMPMPKIGKKSPICGTVVNWYERQDVKDWYEANKTTINEFRARHRESKVK